MKNILIIGVGGTGSRAVDVFNKRIEQFGKHNDNNVTALVFDTDKGDIEQISSATVVPMADPASVGTICDRIGKRYIREWFPCDDMAVRSQEMMKGASQWRKKSYLAFLNLMNNSVKRATFIQALDKMVANPGALCEIYVVSSVAGGTGSGSFIPIALFAKRYLRKNLGKDPIVNAMLALPDIYADSQTEENRIKVYSNAYAILRELNAINLVARNYNAGRTSQKKAPIKLRIGHPDEPNVGVLFDASDKKFWTPTAAPFTQVFLLDKIPAVTSIRAHDMVIANSLYTLICTDIGAEFDSEFSNHELLRSQNNGSNAVYAGISTSQVRFPCDSILSYIAHKKTLDACDNEWLVLHNTVESKLKEKENQAKEMKRRFTLKDGEYAEMVVKAYEDIESNESSNELISIIERSYFSFDDEGKPIDHISAYFDELTSLINSKIPSMESASDQLGNTFLSRKPNTSAVMNAAMDSNTILTQYFIKCVEAIRCTTTSTADSIINFNADRQSYSNGSMFITNNLVAKKDKFIHPVAALVNLCKFRMKLTDELNSLPVGNEWKEIKSRKVTKINPALLELSSDNYDAVSGNGKQSGKTTSKLKIQKSVYAAAGLQRFAEISTNDSFARNYRTSKTHALTDYALMRADASSLLANIMYSAQQQLSAKVLTLIANDIDLLISKYRTFFSRFAKEKDDLAESTKMSRTKDSGNIDSVVNVYSTPEEKDIILKQILDGSGPATDAEVSEIDGVVGEAVYENTCSSAIASKNDDTTWNDKDSTAYLSLFENMINSYAKFIAKSDAFAKVASYSVVEAIVASCGDKPSSQQLVSKFQNHFSVAQDLAQPSLRVDENTDYEDLVAPSRTTVFMMSAGTAKYIKKHAEMFGLRIPADQSDEGQVIKACAEEFIRNYSGDSAARVSIVNSITDQVLYCTGEIMDINPLRIEKFNELSADRAYYTNYCTALKNFKKYDTDMWNPHLGNDLHKRGYLPYMNEAKEKDCDAMVVKALLYALYSKQITYKDGVAAMKGKYYFSYSGKNITDSNGTLINVKNIAKLIAWLRNEDELVEEWCMLFERDIKRQQLALPNFASGTPNEISALESTLTKSLYMKLLTEKIFALPTSKGEEDSITVLELANMVKTSEEIDCDCDDAERILIVAYEVFKSLCEYRTSSKNMPEMFIQIYNQQIEKVYRALADARFIVEAGKDAEVQFNQFAAWLHNTGVFDRINPDMPLDELGNVCIDQPCTAASFDAVKSSLAGVATRSFRAYSSNDSEDGQTSESSDVITE